MKLEDAYFRAGAGLPTISWFRKVGRKDATEMLYRQPCKGTRFTQSTASLANFGRQQSLSALQNDTLEGILY